MGSKCSEPSNEPWDPPFSCIVKVNLTADYRQNPDELQFFKIKDCIKLAGIISSLTFSFNSWVFFIA